MNPDQTPNTTPHRLTTWQHRTGLTADGLAHRIGVPIHTYRKWANGTRRLDAASARLLDVLEALETLAPELADALTPPKPPAKPRTRSSTHAKAQVATTP
jgi:hypothetical protein